MVRAAYQGIRACKTAREEVVTWRCQDHAQQCCQLCRAAKIRYRLPARQPDAAFRCTMHSRQCAAAYPWQSVNGIWREPLYAACSISGPIVRFGEQWHLRGCIGSTANRSEEVLQVTILLVRAHGVPHAHCAVAFEPPIERLDVQVRRAAHPELHKALRGFCTPPPHHDTCLLTFWASTADQLLLAGSISQWPLHAVGRLANRLDSASGREPPPRRGVVHVIPAPHVAGWHPVWASCGAARTSPYSAPIRCPSCCCADRKRRSASLSWSARSHPAPRSSPASPSSAASPSALSLARGRKVRHRSRL